MNAGANGVETRERVVEVVAIDRRGERHVLTNADMGYTYRHSAAPDDLIFVEATYEGAFEDREKIRAEMDAVQAHRESAQPVKTRTGGSTFKNPEGDEGLAADRCRRLPRPAKSATRRSPRCTAISSSTPARRAATTLSSSARRSARAC